MNSKATFAPLANLIVALLTASCFGLHAQEQPAPATPEPALEPTQPEGWSFSASAALYLVPDDHDYLQPTVTADYRWLHLEARYNYEDIETGSTWVGYNFSGGKAITWELTPMVGGVFGNTTGIAPGYSGSVSWWKLELYSEGEYVVVPGDAERSFFYNWSELSLSPLEWFRLGMVTQRTRLYETDHEVQRGVLAGVTFKSVDFTAYFFNPDDSKPLWVFSVGVSF